MRLLHSPTFGATSNKSSCNNLPRWALSLNNFMSAFILMIQNIHSVRLYILRQEARQPHTWPSSSRFQGSSSQTDHQHHIKAGERGRERERESKGPNPRQPPLAPTCNLTHQAVFPKWALCPLTSACSQGSCRILSPKRMERTLEVCVPQFGNSDTHIRHPWLFEGSATRQ